MIPTFNRRLPKHLGSALALMGLLAAVVPAQATIFQVPTRAAMGANGTLSWAQLGADGTELTTSPQAASTSLLVAASVSNAAAAGSLWRFDVGAGTFGDSSFAPGDQLLSTFGTAGPLVITFASPVARVGTQLQSLLPGSFTGLLEAFGAANAPLGSWSVAGVTGDTSDGSAAFLGVVSTAADIVSVRFSVQVPSTDPNPVIPDFSINTVSFSVTPVPEPTSALMLLGGGALLAGVLMQRRKTLAVAAGAQPAA